LGAVLAALVAAGTTIALTKDVIIGIAVGAALFALIDRVTKAWGSPPPVEHEQDHPASPPMSRR
jgi:hypothetical protein